MAVVVFFSIFRAVKIKPMQKLLPILSIFFLLIAAKPDSGSEGVEIGEQIWMNENLSVTSFRNGDPLKYCWNAEEWLKAIKNKRPAYTYYDFDPKNGVTHGCIYNYYVVHDKRPLPPKGWRVPRFEDLKKLNSVSPYLAYFLRSKGNQKDGDGLWANKNYAFENEQDKFGFEALPSGQLIALKSSGIVEFMGMGSKVSWWTESKGQNTKKLQQCWTLQQNFGEMNLEIGHTSQLYSGHYVRCIKKN